LSSQVFLVEVPIIPFRGNRGLGPRPGNMMIVAGRGVRGGADYGSGAEVGTGDQVDDGLQVTND